ncbi:MAG: polyphosphate:AMP phosphotransferase [Acidaminococcaceae bacterium]|jgi:polyphosphate:AMP phosphotransferase|nr:polyphosphate:AMP phosphotransferase [Acidaminococcaceae bacterium]
MLEKVNLKKKIKKSDYEEQFPKLLEKLGALQRELRDAEIPVIILFEGFRGSWRGLLINKLISALDPRGFRVFSASKTTEKQKQEPFFAQFWKELPAAGQINIHHRAWYFLRNEHAVGDKDEASEWYHVSFGEINAFEKELTDEGYVILKIFTHISAKQQEKNIAKGFQTSGSQWESLTPGGIEGINYKAYEKVYEDMLAKTDMDYAPWHIVPLENKRTGIITTLKILIEELTLALQKRKQEKPEKPASVNDETVPDILSNYDLTKAISEKAYEEKYKKLRKRLGELQLKLYEKKISTIVAFEGWDAGGKGGAIKRLTAGLDPLGYMVNPVRAPNDWEKRFHYLWRFWQHIPAPGETAIFDRTWYGRVLVERVEGFATVQQWRRAYQEINDMEAQWAKQGFIVQKFWMQIDKDEQYDRFKARENDPDKTWKITEEDWRNRDKWGAYEAAVNEMLYRTDTKEAPWTVVEAKSKFYARIKVMETMIKRMEQALEK